MRCLGLSKKSKGERDLSSALFKINLWETLDSKATATQVTQEWIRPYEEEERHGIAIAHRQLRLIHAHSHRHYFDGDKPPDYKGPTATKLENEMTVLREEHWRHEIRLGQLFDARPYSTTVKGFVYQRQYRDDKNRPLAWVHDVEKCAARSGCCGRSCGCCTRALKAYVYDGMVFETFGHCTVECACCISYRACYIPDPRLPSTEFQPL